MSPLLIATFVFAVIPMLLGSAHEDSLVHGVSSPGKVDELRHEPMGRPFG